MSIFAIFTPVAATSTLAPAEPSSELSAKLDSLLTERYPDSSEPGCAVLIAKGNKVLYQGCRGMARLDNPTPITPKTRFCIASISKHFTVAALMQQVMAGKVSLRDNGQQHFGYNNPLWRRVTLEHLASHTSGIPDSRDRSTAEARLFANDESSVQYFNNVEATKFAPGSAYDYLNPSFLLLAKVVENQSGMNFTEYMAEKVFSPAGMVNTYYFEPSRALDSADAHGYEPDNKGGFSKCDYGEASFYATRPDGGIYSTLEDMHRWSMALDGDKIIDRKSFRAMTTPRVATSGSKWCEYESWPDTFYGLGLFIENRRDWPLKIYHTGDNGGFQAYFAKYPDNGITIIILENRNDRDRRRLTTEIDNILREGKII